MSIFGQNVYLDLLELDENLYLRSKGCVSNTYLDDIKIGQLEVSKQYHFVHRINFFKILKIFFCKFSLSNFVVLSTLGDH